MTRRLLAIVLFAAAGPLAAAPFAMITELKGDAWYVNGGEPRKLTLLTYVEKPMQIRVDPAAKLAVTYFANGVQYRFAGPSRLSLERSNPSVTEGAQPQARKVTPEKSIGGGLSPEQWRRLQQATVVMRSVRPGFSVVGPDKTTLIDREPEFEWTAAPNAKAYRLVVYGADNSLIHEQRTEENVLRAGSALMLQPGKRYRWKVDAIGVQKPVSTTGTFAVAEKPVRQDMRVVKASAESDVAARAFYATALEAHGYAHDARAEWKALARDYPDEPELRQRAR